MATLFCSETYAARLKERGMPVEMAAVASDHWSILNSKPFSDALRAALVDQRWPPSPPPKNLPGE